MALQNSQYDALMRYYQRLQFRNKHEQGCPHRRSPGKDSRLAEQTGKSPRQCKKSPDFTG